MARDMRDLIASFLLCSSLLIFPVAGDLRFTDCPNNMNYTSGGGFQASLDSLLSSMPAAAAAASGFARNSTGSQPDQAFALAQCRADVADSHECRACLDASVRDMATKCPGQKAAIFIYDQCLLRHSNASFFGVADSSVAVYIYNTQNATEPGFSLRLGSLMANLTEKAAYASPRMFAVGTAAVTPFVTIYGMAQCTRDLAADDCNSCLVGAVANLPNCCSEKKGGLLIGRSCSIQFEVGPFYNLQAAEAAMSPPPPAAGGGVDGSENSGKVTTGKRSNSATALLVSIPVAVVVLVLVVLAVSLYLCKKKRKTQNRFHIVRADHGDEDGMGSAESLLYDLTTLRAATDNFSEANKLGEGGFGPVYKGTLLDGSEIAVKRLSKTSQQGHVEMKNEVVLVAKLQHKNLVRLLGCCIEEQEKLLVYELLSNRSLDKIIFDPARQHELTWGQRFKIIQGIARGLVYLHEDSRLTIIHRDLKVSNILLDPDMNPKISDFGLAKLFNVDGASVGNTSHIAGTYGYMAPEYALHGIYSAKSDVFSYGVLVLEIVTGRRNAFCYDPAAKGDDLLTTVWRDWTRGSVSLLLDGCSACGKRPQEILRCIHVGLLCVQDDPQLRPGMAVVAVMLNSHSITLPAPATPAFVVRSRAAGDPAATSTPRETPAGAGRTPPSVNDASVSDLDPR